jgi:hypothetical protein
MLRARPGRSRSYGEAGALVRDDSGFFEEDGLTSGEVQLYGGRSAAWSSSLPKELLQELLKQQMAVAYRPPGERARALMASRVWEHLRDGSDAEQLLRHIVGLELYELQSMWTGLVG